MKKVLIVDDSMYMRTLINSALSATGRYEVIGQAGTGNQGIEMALEHEPDLITMDNILPDMIGIDIVKELRAEGIVSKIIMVSAVGQDDVVAEGKANGAQDYLVKPFTAEVLVERVDNLFA
ncbi:MAG: response regulator [Fluviicola sp.]|jgi:two-component system chemotaxis response regulator CheY|nr:response regulator [Fluviicola sp.]